MRKAKIMLSALVVLAIVGSALAFKVSRTFIGNLRCTNTTTTTTICSLATYTTTNCITGVGTIMACTFIDAHIDAVCTTTCVTFVD